MFNLVMCRILAGSVSEMAEFYATITQTAATGGGDYFEISTDAATIAICSRSLVADWAIPAESSNGSRTIVEFMVDDVDAHFDRLNEVLSIEWIVEPKDQPWGTRSAVFKDPEGNLVNIFAAQS